MDINKGILYLEFKGFTAMATDLAFRMEQIGVTAERVRATGITIVEELLDNVSQLWLPSQREHLGGDTWALVFETLEEALSFGCIALRTFQTLATDKAVFFLKPSIAVGCGLPKWKKGRPLDDTSITSYTVADKGKPYQLVLVGDAVHISKQYDWLKLDEAVTIDKIDAILHAVKWQEVVVPKGDNVIEIDVAIPQLLLDSEVILSNTVPEAVANIIRHQRTARSVLAYGGPVPYDVGEYQDYLRFAVQRIKGDDEFKISILTFLPKDELKYCYAWIELIRRLSIEYPERVACAAFVLPDGQLRPLSYHIYDDDFVHMGLRSYVPQRGVETLSASITFRNFEIAQRFRSEFLENWRRFGPLDDSRIAKLLEELGQVDRKIKQDALAAIEELLKS